MSTGKSVSIQADVYWACLNHLNPIANKYTVNLANLSDKAVQALEEMGVTVLSNPAKRPEEGSYITCKSINPIKAFDKQGNEYDADIKIGNGSKAVAVVSTYSWKSPTGKKGISPSLRKLTINDLVVYESKEEVEDDVL